MFPIDQLLILVLLALAGEPIRRLMSIGLKAFKSLDIFQVVILDFYLGGFIFFVVASIPFGLFRPLFTFCFLGASIVISLAFIFHDYFQYGKSDLGFLTRISKQLSRNSILCGIALLAIFFLIMWIEADATNGILFGNVHDASLFSMLAHIISQQGMIPATLNPFDPSPLVYPQGFTIILNFSSYLFNSGPENMILVLVPLFQALGILGAYSVGKMWLGKMHYGVLFAFLFAFVSRWPKLLVWGSYAFVAAFPLFLVVLGLIPVLAKTSNESRHGRLLEFLSIGLLIGYLGAIHATFYEVVISALGIIAISRMLRRRGVIRSELSRFSLIFIFSLVPVSLFLWRFVGNYLMPNPTLGLPNDIVIPQLASLGQNYNLIVENFLSSDWISPYPVLRILTLVLLTLAVVIFAIFLKRGLLHQIGFVSRLSLSILFASLFIVGIGSKEVGLAFLTFAINTSETAILFFVSLILLLGIVLAKISDEILAFVKRNFSKAFAAVILVLLFFSAFSPFMYYTLTGDTNYCHGVYNTLAVSTPDDYALMRDMRNLLPTNSVVLINPSDAGGFIPTIDGYKIVYPFTEARNSVSYSNLCDLILNENFNATTYDLLHQFNITHVFVGSKATDYSGTRDWKPILFLGNPNFKLVDKVGNSYLFAFKPEKNNIVFFDNFESSSLQDEGWTTIQSTRGNGTLVISTVSGVQHNFDENNSLMLAAQSNANSSELGWLQHMIYIPIQLGNVTLSFNLNSSAPFKNYEGLTLIVSSENWTSQLRVSTWDRGDSIWMLRSSGSYKVNLSSLWTAKFNEPLPNRIYLQAEIFDSDGIQDKFFINSLAISTDG